MNTSAQGTATEAVVLAALVKRGERVLIPFGDGSRYDLVIDRSGEFIRVQCKTARYIKGCVVFKAYSSKRDRTPMNYYDDADVFGVWCPSLDKSYLVPVREVPDNTPYLRIDTPKNGQVKRIIWAKDYEI